MDSIPDSITDLDASSEKEDIARIAVRLMGVYFLFAAAYSLFKMPVDLFAFAIISPFSAENSLQTKLLGGVLVADFLTGIINLTFIVYLLKNGKAAYKAILKFTTPICDQLQGKALSAVLATKSIGVFIIVYVLREACFFIVEGLWKIIFLSLTMNGPISEGGADYKTIIVDSVKQSFIGYVIAITLLLLVAWYILKKGSLLEKLLGR